jgi:hypothetical protein
MHDKEEVRPRNHVVGMDSPLDICSAKGMYGKAEQIMTSI